MKNRLEAAIFLCTLFLLSSCATSSLKLTNHGNINSPIVMKSYSISFPDDSKWKKWGLTKKDHNSLVFERLHSTLAGEIKGNSTIFVSVSVVPLEQDGMSDEAIASNIIESEERNMHELGEKTGSYELSEIEKKVIMHNDKKLYVFQWKASKGSDLTALLIRSRFVKGAMFIYLPSRRDDRRFVFKIVLTLSYIPELVKMKTDTVFEIIDGLIVH